jgi:hypothetical protein
MELVIVIHDHVLISSEAAAETVSLNNFRTSYNCGSEIVGMPIDCTYRNECFVWHPLC